ncbi:MAG: phosphoenolpyruvate carboxylase [Gammaproteobacteria bacterium]|nr:phosphoenolpyruvate carboxylase [Gammaproteobacteria bacterium]
MSTPVKKDSPTAAKRQGLRFAEKDEALRNDVRELGKMVGELLMEQGGEALYKTVESARRLAIRRRENESEASDKLVQLLSGLSPDAARDVVRAFSTYFQVVNNAEQVHRIRRRREYLKDADVQQPRSFDATFLQLKEAGYEPEAVEKLLSQLAIQPVFTAHPTETTRRTVLRKQQNIVRRMVDVQNPALTPQETRACFANIRADVTAIWQTEESPLDGLTVFDEQEHTLFFVTDVIYRVIPPFYEAIESAITDIYGSDAQVDIPNMLHFGSWIGGDLSVNRDLSARTIRDTMARQRTLLLDLYYRDCQDLGEKLSQSESRVDVDEAVRERIDQYARQFPGAHGSTPHRYRRMPYRVLLRLINERLQATFDEGAFPYETVHSFIDDLQIIANSLQSRRGANAGLFAVRRLIRRAEAFGFHFLSLDIRHDARELQRVVGECMGETNWLELSHEVRTDRLRQALTANASPLVEPNNDAKRLFSIFRAIGYCRRKYGDPAIGAMLVRHCAGPDDALAALLLARWADLHSADGWVPLDIVPCFENAAELRRAPQLITALMEDSYYRSNLEARGLHQTVMLSISESNSACSVTSSRWDMQKAHFKLTEIFEAADVDFTFFHGRGSLSGRGGVADGIAHGHLRATEHGEAVNERYGVRAIAVRTLEKAFSAVTTATAGLRSNEVSDPVWLSIMTDMAVAADQKYAELADDGFDDYFRLATPIDVIAHMRGSSEETLAPENLPWAFAWAQSRFLLPAWYGFGTGLRTCMENYGVDTLQTMLRDWPFFRRLADDVEIALAIADLGIAEHYSQLAGPELHAHYFPLIREEYECSVTALLQLQKQEALLEGNATLRRSIRLRNPYVDPMSLLQVSLLKRWRDDGSTNGKLLTALRASVNGISHGIQTTG